MLMLMVVFALLMVLNSDSILDSLLVLLSLEVLIYLISMAKVWFHVIMMLILLEFFSIKGFVVLAIKSSVMINSGALFLYSVLMVCEASLGMGLMVSISRGRGDESVVI